MNERQFNLNSPPLRLNLGSGQRPFKGWVNCDSQARWNPDLVCDIRKLPWEQPVAEIIVLHQVLEHLDCTGGPGLLRECYRVLLPSGSLLVFAPDLLALAKRWVSRELDDDYIYTVNLYGAYMSDEADRHKWGYSYRSLFAAMREAGFKTIRPFDWRDIPGADLARDWWVLAMEGVK